VKHSVAIEQHRIAFLKLFQLELCSVIDALDSNLTEHKIAYKNGWGMQKLDFNDIESAEIATETELLAAMRASFAKDCQFQRTHLGPQKADLQLRINQHDIRDIYSRGQKKTVVAAMKLAQAKVVSRETMQRPILLLDDLPSELDDKHLQAFMRHVVAENYQCFITAVDDHQFNEIGLENSHMFHVERGKISPMIAQGEAQE
jgi:recombinational DNA repair ATPase RecF